MLLSLFCLDYIKELIIEAVSKISEKFGKGNKKEYTYLLDQICNEGSYAAYGEGGDEYILFSLDLIDENIVRQNGLTKNSEFHNNLMRSAYELGYPDNVDKEARTCKTTSNFQKKIEW